VRAIPRHRATPCLSALLAVRRWAEAAELARSPELTNDDLSTIGKIVEIVSPLLHHATTLGEVLGVIVGGADLVALVMGKLAFDPIGMKTHFV
jgi:hypothetical protein